MGTGSDDVMCSWFLILKFLVLPLANCLSLVLDSVVNSDGCLTLLLPCVSALLEEQRSPSFICVEIAVAQSQLMAQTET